VGEVTSNIRRKVMTKKTTVKFLKDVDDVMHVLTGKRIKDVAAKAAEIFGRDIVNMLMSEAPVHLSADDPYNILEVRPDASDLVVKAVYRAKVKLLHPDNKETGNAEQFKRIQEAYDKIIQARKPYIHT